MRFTCDENQCDNVEQGWFATRAIDSMRQDIFGMTLIEVLNQNTMKSTKYRNVEKLPEIIDEIIQEKCLTFSKNMNFIPDQYGFKHLSH